MQIFSLQPGKNGVQYIGIIVGIFSGKTEATTMSNRKKPFSRIRLVYRRSSPLLKCVVLTAIVLCTVCLMVLRSSILEEKAKMEELRSQAAVLEQENRQMETNIEELGTVESVKRIALELLGLTTPDTIIFQTNESNPE